MRKYTEDELLSDLYRFVQENNRVPRYIDMNPSNGYISVAVYQKRFKTWNNALKYANLPVNQNTYTETELINSLQNLAKILGRTPSVNDIAGLKDFPSQIAFLNAFDSWNNALIKSGLPINQIQTVLTGDETCAICGHRTSKNLWSIVDGKRICGNCNSGPRNYLHGVLNPNSHTGIGVITEHVVHEVLGDCEKCNTTEHFFAPYDLSSKKYGSINVKSSRVYKCKHASAQRWHFTKHLSGIIPDNYICLAFDENKYNIEHVWIIPGNSYLVKKSGISISNSLKSLSRAIQYEVDPEPYNKVYQELDIYTLPEFCNLPREEYNDN